MSITAKQISDLRAKTGAGMMDCKKALTETNGDFEAAVDFLRKKGVAAAAKKSSNTAAEGLVAAKTAGKIGVVVELNSQTDFVARNDKFQALVATTADMVLSVGETNVDALLAANYPGSSHTLKDQITESIAVIGENMNLRRVAKLSVLNGVVVSYVHNEVVPGLGKIAVLVALESSANADKLTPVARQIAMHVAAAKPEALDVSAVDASALEREKAIFADQAKASGKPDSIIEKMVEGRVRKYYEEIVLLEQVFVIDGKTKISEVVANLAKECGADVKLTGFIRFALGEGIEQTTSNFADEVKAAAGL